MDFIVTASLQGVLHIEPILATFSLLIAPLALTRVVIRQILNTLKARLAAKPRHALFLEPLPMISDESTRILQDLPVGLVASGRRCEFDSMGNVDVPADRYWRAQPQRSFQHFADGFDAGSKFSLRDLARNINRVQD